MKKLFYTEPARIWNEALPLGNGRMGAMVYSDPFYDCLALNEDTLWSGAPAEDTKQSMQVIEEIREQAAAGNLIEADRLAKQTMHSFQTQAYMPYGKLYIQLLSEKADISDYSRTLDLEQGIAASSFLLNGNRIKKTLFTSLADDVLVIHLQSEKPISVKFFEAVDLEHSSRSQGNILLVTGRCPTTVAWPDVTDYDDRESIHFASALQLFSDGNTVFGGGGSCHATGATRVTALFSICTSFNGFDKMPVSQGREYIQRCRDILTRAAQMDYAQLLQRHVEKYRAQFDRVSLELEGEDFSHIPTDQRIRDAAAGKTDNKLTELLFDYARYLTISGSQPGTQAMNLQGIWNQNVIPPWRCNYTININTQMNYWPTEICNLPECHEPLMQMLRQLRSRGNVFGLRGWAAWHNTDLWRFHNEASGETLYGYWQMGGFWLCRHIWEHYIHTRDLGFLREYYPVMEEAAWFLEDWMIEKDGWFTTCPSSSPENQYEINGQVGAVCEGSAMDMQIIADLFDKLIRMGKLLNKDTDHYEAIYRRLKPTLLGEDGRILEWGQALPEKELGHRHISHLYGFHPSDVLSYESYGEAVRKTLESRLAHGGGHTGWSNAWIANVYARLGDGEATQACIQKYIQTCYPNLLDAHPPFQIDGNFGICAAICEALMQDHTGQIRLLPALPRQWHSGAVRGFIARTGQTVSFRWADGKLTDVEIQPKCNKVM